MNKENSKNKEEIKFVTTDIQMKEFKGKLSETDKVVQKAAETGEGLIKIKSSEEFMELAKLAGEVHDSFLDLSSKIMDKEKADFVRKLRVDEGYSWRAVAEECYKIWGGNWQPPSNQLMGMVLCEKAAEFFDENYMTTPWNG